MTPATVLALLGAPALWLCTNADPLTVCQASGDVCLVQSPHEVLLTQTDDAGEVTITPLVGPTAAVAQNLIVLRAADAMGLARDRAERARQERGR